MANKGRNKSASGNNGGFRTIKSLGQNFLNNPMIVEEIVEASGAGEEDLVLEIGPGQGVMTSVLAESAGFVLAIEIDTRLEPHLNTVRLCHPNVDVIYDDFMKLDINPILKDYLEKYSLSGVRVVANLPYYITTPIIMKILENIPAGLKSLTVMVQKEVALRMTALPGGKDYGAMSVSVQYFTKPQIALHVPAHNFVPRPNVDSSVVHMQIREKAPFDVPDLDYFFRVVKASFAQRRKMLTNSLANSGLGGVTREICAMALEQIGKDVNIRGEVLSPEEFARLSQILYLYSQQSEKN